MEENALSRLSKDFKIFFAVYLLFFSITYIALQDRYRPDDSDDAAAPSFAYNYLHRGIDYDVIFGFTSADSTGPSGVQFFEKTYAIMIGKIFDVVGWTKTNGHLISLVLLLISVFLWSRVWIHLKYSPEIAYSATFSMLLLDPYFSAATSTRPDAFVFMLIAFSLLLFVKQYYFFSILAACVAFESHPMGCVAFVYMAALVIAPIPTRETFWKKGSRNTLVIIGGFLIGLLYFYWLHPQTMMQLPHVFNKSNFSTSRSVQNFIFEYFFETKYLRHIPELILTVIFAFLYLSRKMHQTDPFIPILTVLVIIFSFILERPNFRYMVYIYPAFLLLIFRCSETLRITRGVLIGLLFLCIPQYLYAYFLNRDFSFRAEINLMKSAVPNDGLPIVGGANEWFAFHQRDFYVNTYDGNFLKLGLRKFYLIEDDRYRESSSRTKDFIKRLYAEKPLQELKINRRVFFLKLETLKGLPAQHS